MARKQQVDSRLGNRVERQFAATGGASGPCLATGSASNGWWVTRILTVFSSDRSKVRRIKSIWSWLIRPSLNVSDRAVLIPRIATPSSSWNGHKLSSTKRM